MIMSVCQHRFSAETDNSSTCSSQLFTHDDFEWCQMKLLQHSENLLMLFNGCDDDVRYVVVEPEYVKHHHRLIKDDEFVV